MQVIYKIDIIFTVIYSLLGLLVGGVIALAVEQMIFLIIALVGVALYLFFALRRPYRRFKAISRSMPEKWKRFLTDKSPFYHNLDVSGKNRFERDILIFLSDFSIEGIRRQMLDMETRLLVAAGFATLLHGRPYWEPPIKDGVLVYPGDRFSRDYQVGKGVFAGMATANSPLIVSQGSLEHSFKQPGDGYNVIYHELAHYFDLEDGRGEGIPAARLSGEQRLQWESLIAEEWQKVLKGESFLDPYAGKNEAELFAVAVEYFFEKPGLLYENSQELYDALKDFFNVDPLAIMTAN